MKKLTFILVSILLFLGVSFAQSIRINEVMSSNATTISNINESYYDWIELFNESSDTLDLNGYYLSDDPSDPYKWQFQDFYLNPHEYLLVWASEKDLQAGSLPPDSLDHLQCWFSASDIDTTNNVQVEYDQGEYYIKKWFSHNEANYAQQNTVIKRPTIVYNAINGNPAVRFNGIKNILISDLNPPDSNNSRTLMVMVANTDMLNLNQKTNNHILHYGGYGEHQTYGICFERLDYGGGIGNHYWLDNFYGIKVMDSNKHVISAVYHDNSDNFYMDGAYGGTNYQILNTSTSNTMRIGSRIGSGSDYFGGDIAEVIVFDTALSENQRRRVENYLATKYGMEIQNFHTNFKLSSSGETLVLSNPEGAVIDQFVIPYLATDQSFGVVGDTTAYFSIPTPGSENNTVSYTEILTPPDFSVESGFFTDTVNLSITTNDPEAIILYTLDGSDPDTSAINGFEFPVKYDYSICNEGEITNRTSHTYIYSGSLKIGPKNNVPNDRSQITSAYFMWIPPTKHITKATVIKAAVWKPNSLMSKVIAKTYFVDSTALTRYTLPVISVITPDYNLFDYDTGIYVPGTYYDQTCTEQTKDANYKHDDWERPADFEIFDNLGNLLYRQKAGVRIHGNFSTNWSRKSFRFEARKKYENSVFNFELFPGLKQYQEVGGKVIDEFNCFLVRNSGNKVNINLFHDAMVQSLVMHLGVDGQTSRAVDLFLNGEYWGILNFREKHDEQYFAQHYDMDPDDVIIANARTATISSGYQYEYDSYTDIERFVRDNSMADPENYDYVNTKIDIDNYLIHFMVEIYINNNDFLGNNRKFWRKRTPSYQPEASFGQDGRWRWLLYDVDQSFSDPSFDRLTATTTGNEISTIILRGLLENQNFETKFINSFCDQINTSFVPQRVEYIIDSMKTNMEHDVLEHIDRWQGTMTPDQGIDNLIAFAYARPSYMLTQLKERFELDDTCTITLNTFARKGKIKINSIAIDSTTIGLTNSNTPYPWSGTYFRGVPVCLVATPEPGCKFVEWDGVSTSDTLMVNLTSDTTFTAIFEAIAPQSGEIVINEINYQSPESADAGDWFELFNAAEKDYVISNWTIKNGTGETFEISANKTIAANQYMVICMDTTKFMATHPNIANFAGQLPFGFEGEDAIVVFNEFGEMLDSVNYQNTQPWPESTGGTGATLELINSDSSNLVPENWQASYVKAGTPGRANSKPSSAIRINEIMADNETTIAAPDGKFSDWIEIYNPLDVPVNIAGLYFTDDPDEKDKHQIPASSLDSTLMLPNSYLLLWADGDPEEGVYHLDFKLSKNGEFVGISGADAESIIDSISFGEQSDDVSFGRFPNGFGDFTFFEHATPEMPNGFKQEIVIGSGWSGISSYLAPWDGDLENIFSQQSDKLIILLNETGIFWPGQNINTLNNWNAKDAFLVKTSDTMSIEISALSEAENEISLFPGWTLIPCLASANVSVEELFEKMGDDIDIIKEVAGLWMYWPDHNIYTLQYLEPGKAYLIFATEECELEFPE